MRHLFSAIINQASLTSFVTQTMFQRTRSDPFSLALTIAGNALHFCLHAHEVTSPAIAEFNHIHGSEQIQYSCPE